MSNDSMSGLKENPLGACESTLAYLQYQCTCIKILIAMHDSYSLIHYKEVLTHYLTHYTLVYFKDTAIENVIINVIINQ